MSEIDGQGGAPAPSAEGGSFPENNIADAVGRDETTDFVLDAFEGMNRDYDDDDLDVAPAATPDVKNPNGAAAPEDGAKAPQDQSAKASEIGGKAMPPPAAGAQPPAEPPNAPSQAAPAASPSDGGSPDQVWSRLTGMIEQNRQAFTEALAQKSYQLSPQELDEFQVEPAKVIANIAARVQVQTTESLMKVMNQQLPIYLHGLLQAKSLSDAREDKFWNANPGLNKAEHADVVKSIAQWYRAQNPNGDEADFTKVVGSMAMARLGLVHNAVQQAAAAQQSNAPQTVIGTPGRVVRAVTPPAPVPGMHGAPPSSHPAPPMNEWDRIARMMETYEGE